MTNQEAIEIIDNFIIDTGEFDYNLILFKALEKAMNALKFVDEVKIRSNNI